MGQKVIKFTGLTTIPANYEGFNWTKYTIDDEFQGSVPVTNNSIYGVGFEAVLVNASSGFTLNNILVEGASSEPVEIEVIGYSGGTVTYNETIIPEETPSRITFPSQTIDKVQFKSIMMNTFRVFEVVVTV